MDFDYSGPDSELKLGATLAIVSTALRKTVVTTAEQQSDPLAWLDDLQQVLIRQAENTVTEGVAIQAEAGSLQFGVDVLQAILDGARADIVRKD